MRFATFAAHLLPRVELLEPASTGRDPLRPRGRKGSILCCKSWLGSRGVAACAGWEELRQKPRVVELAWKQASAETELLVCLSRSAWGRLRRNPPARPCFPATGAARRRRPALRTRALRMRGKTRQPRAARACDKRASLARREKGVRTRRSARTPSAWWQSRRPTFQPYDYERRPNLRPPQLRTPLPQKLPAREEEKLAVRARV